MLNKLRWRFISVATSSLALVLLLLIVGINGLYRFEFDRNADSILRLIAEHEGTIPPYAEEPGPRLFGRSLLSPESPFDVRFFTAWLDDDGEIVRTQMEHIHSVTGDNVSQYVARAAEVGSEYGYVDQYRFYRCEDYDRTLYIFLSCYRGQTMTWKLLWISFVLAFIILSGAAILVYLFSRQAIAPVIQNMERQQRFITDASHEIKTPVTVIGSYASLMVMEEPQNEWAAAIEKETGRLSAMVNDLVKLSRWDEEGPFVEKERFSLSEAIWDLLPTYRKLAESGGHDLTAHIQENVSISGDEGAIQNAISALLENAVAYALPGGVITVELETKRKTARLRVSNPCQLPADVTPERLFDRFYRADPSHSRASGGNGIGLSLSRAIVEAHGGAVRARLEGGQIAFTITLPL